MLLFLFIRTDIIYILSVLIIIIDIYFYNIYIKSRNLFLAIINIIYYWILNIDCNSS